MPACHNCHTEYPTVRPFCSNCGSALSAPPPAAINFGAVSVTDTAALARAVGPGFYLAQILLIGLALFALLCLSLKGPWLSFFQKAGVRVTLMLLGSIVLPPLWLLWQRSAYGALRAMGSGQRRYSGVIRSWLIPFLNLFRPYQLTRDLWIRSASGNPAYLTRSTPTLLVVAWWMAFLGPLIVFAGDFLSESTIETALAWIPVTAAVLGALVVIKIQDFQLAQAERPERLSRMSGAFLKMGSGLGLLGAIVWVGFTIKAEWAGPEDSMQALIQAYKNHDAETFRRYCHTVELLDQQYLIIRNNPDLSSARDNLPLPAAILATVFGSQMASNYEENHEEFARQVEDTWVGGAGLYGLDFPSWLADHIPGGAGPLGNIGIGLNKFLKASAEQMHRRFNSEFRGISSVTYDGGDALVKLRLDEASDGKVIHGFYTFRMKRSGLHWRVVRFEGSKLELQ